MDILETSATLDTQDNDQRQTKQQTQHRKQTTTKKMKKKTCLCHLLLVESFKKNQYKPIRNLIYGFIRRKSWIEVSITAISKTL